MRYGVFGDIHSNLAAFQTVLDGLRTQKVDGYLCLGDIVGYGADARECVEIVRDLDPVIVAGNHDFAVAGRLGLEYFNTQAQAAIVWTRRELDAESIEWLGSLPLREVVGDVTLAHGTMHEPEAFQYMQTPYDAYLSFQDMQTRTGFVGHSHIPVTFFDGMPITYSVDHRIEFGDRIAIANPGSVGQPRDEDPRAAYAVYDSETRVLEIHRAEYDIGATIGRILRAGLPVLLGERLRIGR
ncbi:MAG: metallophosphoesterase family protein [Planctomycetota bacterium]|nr:metallophosphoesterase family protein [Planctomycetota bacterium]